MTVIAVTMAELAGYLEREMKQQGWSLRRAATEWGVDKSTLSLIMNKPERRPDPDTLQALARGLGVPFVRLLELAGYPIDLHDDPALYGLTEQERATLRSLSPQRRAALLRMAREMQDEDRK